MRLRGRLFIEGAKDRKIPILLTLDERLRIEEASGAPVGIVSPRFVSVDQTSETSFVLGLSHGRFGFTTGDAGTPVSDFVSELSALIERARTEAETPEVGPDEGSTWSGVAQRDARLGAPAVEELPPIGGPLSDDELANRAKPDAMSVARRLREGIDGVDSEAAARPPEPDEVAGGNGDRALRPVRLDPKLAARLGLPLRPLRGQRRPAEHRTVEVGGGVSMAYRSAGKGRPVLMLGGGIGSMDIWRGVVPHVSSTAHVVSIDLIGFGLSDRIPGADITWYDWDTHVAFLDVCLDRLGLGDDLTVVCHGWNTIVGLEWTRLYEDRVRAIVYVDPILRPLAWVEVDPWLREAVKRARKGKADGYVLDSDDFLLEAMEAFLPGDVTSALVDEYRAAMGPFGASRLAHLAAIAHLPVGGRPRRATEMMHACRDWLKVTQIPKLLILGRPGYLLVNQGRVMASRYPRTTLATVEGKHLLAETSPDAIGRFLQFWLQSV